MDQFPWCAEPDGDPSFDNRVREEALIQNLGAFLASFCPYGKITWKLEVLLQSVNFQYFLAAPYPVWTYNPANVVSSKMYLAVCDVVTSGTAYEGKPSTGQVNALMSALRDICFNPFVPIEYVDALSVASPSARLGVLQKSRQYLRSVLSSLEQTVKSNLGFVSPRFCLLYNDVRITANHLDSVSATPDMHMVKKLIRMCREVQDNLALIRDNIGPVILPELPTMPGSDEVEMLRYSNMEEYIPFRTVQFIEEWNSASES